MNDPWGDLEQERDDALGKLRELAGAVKAVLVFAEGQARGGLINAAWVVEKLGPRALLDQGCEKHGRVDCEDCYLDALTSDQPPQEEAPGMLDPEAQQEEPPQPPSQEESQERQDERLKRISEEGTNLRPTTFAELRRKPPGQEEPDPDPYFGRPTGRECAACGVDEKVGDEGWESNEHDVWCADCWVEAPSQPTPGREEQPDLDWPTVFAYWPKTGAIRDPFPRFCPTQPATIELIEKYVPRSLYEHVLAEALDLADEAGEWKRQAEENAEQPDGDQVVAELVRKAIRDWSAQPECDKLAGHEEDEVTDAVMSALGGRHGSDV